MTSTQLEEMWAGEFGRKYIYRNLKVGDHREKFWNDITTRYPIQSVLEVGCNIGANLMWLVSKCKHGGTFGIDVNEAALTTLRERIRGVNTLVCPARDIPYKDSAFDMVFTMGVLIHIGDDSLRTVMTEIVRCAAKYVLCAEYFSPEPQVLLERGGVQYPAGSLTSRPYDKLYLEWFPELRVAESGFLSRDRGWDDVHYVVLEKQK